MTDEPLPDQPPLEPTEGAFEGPPGEEEINALLDDVSVLAAELTDEVGRPDPPDASAVVDGADKALAGEGDPAEDIDAQLAEMQGLLDSAQDEVGSESAANDEATSDAVSSEAAPDSQAGEQAIETPPPPAAQDTPPAQADLGSDATFEVDPSEVDSLPSFDDDESASPSPTAAVAEASPPSPSPAGQNTAPADSPEPARPRTGGLVRKIASPAALAVCNLGVQVLEQADKPFGMVGPRIRLALGWVALATLATAAVVFLISLL